MPDPEPVDEVPRAAAHEEAEGDGKHGVPRAGAGEVGHHPANGDRGEDRQIGVALAKRPNAMPEFWTWWIENGPATWRSASRSSLRATRSFVSWSPASQSRDREEPTPLLHACGEGR